jgi:hypothetical protein
MSRGSVTLWMAGLALVVLTVGGLAVDLWRLVTVRSSLAAAADSAALAAASQIDEVAWREEGILRLDPERAMSRAAQVIAAQPGRPLLGPDWFTVDADGTVVVRLRAEVPTTLLRLAGLNAVEVQAAARAAPLLIP